MNSSQHFTEFRVRNFKRFGDLQVKDLGRINLIVGDNGVGKTSLLEALLADPDPMVLLKRLHRTLCFRNIHIHARSHVVRDGLSVSVPRFNYLDLLRNDTTKPLEVQAKTKSGAKWELSLETVTLGALRAETRDPRFVLKFSGMGPDTLVVRAKSASRTAVMPLFADDLAAIHNFQIPFIPASRKYDDDLMNGYQSALAPSRTVRERFITHLRIILPGAQEVLPRRVHETDHLAVVVEGSDESHPLTRFGDGAVKCARIFMEVARSQEGRVMVDELDAGIHHRRLDKLWSVLIQAAVEHGIQLFAVTHSLECLQSLKRVFESGDLASWQNEVRCIALSELPDRKTVKAYTYPWTEFEAAINHDNELR